MDTPNDSSSEKIFLSRAIEASIRIALVVMLAAWCFRIVEPFITIILRGIIIAVAANPGYNWLQSRLGGRPGLAATLVTVLALVVLITPTVMLSATLVDSVQVLALSYELFLAWLNESLPSVAELSDTASLTSMDTPSGSGRV